MLTIDISAPEPIFEQIISQIGCAIYDGTIVPGDKLPSIRLIAKDLEINPNTVAKAYMVLEDNGMIITRGRAGSFVSKESSINYERWLEAFVQKELRVSWQKLQGISPSKKLSLKIWKLASTNLKKEK